MVESSETKPKTSKTWRDKSLSPKERFDLYLADQDVSLIEEIDRKAYLAEELAALVPRALDILMKLAALVAPTRF
jgi:hypothetical protein